MVLSQFLYNFVNKTTSSIRQEWRYGNWPCTQPGIDVSAENVVKKILHGSYVLWSPRDISSLRVAILDSVYDSFVCRPQGKNAAMRIQWKPGVLSLMALEDGGTIFTSPDPIFYSRQSPSDRIRALGICYLAAVSA